MFWFVLLLLAVFLWVFARYALEGPDLSHFDTPVGQRFAAHPDDREATDEFIETIRAAEKRAKDTRSFKKALGVIREFADNLSSSLESDCQFKTVDANGVPCEWAIAPNADPKRRVLFLHGGAFIMGSPKGHRFFGHTLSHLAKAAVLSVDYRMLPENKRITASEDAQTAYKWLLENGPDGATELDMLLVAGDSAGGNLAIMLSGWSKANAPRQANGVIGFSPSLDSTIAAPTYQQNRKTDILLGKPLGFLSRLPRTIGLWLGLFLWRLKPNNTILSPLFGDLDHLSPTLIHASGSEVLLGDAVRYTNKAQAAGSDVNLQIWEDQIHDWHLFNPESGSGKEAWGEIEKFIGGL